MWQRWTGTQHDSEDEKSDELLLAALARGEESAFLIVYRRRQASIYRYALHLCGDSDVAAETVQETFLALLLDAGRLDGTRGTVLAWLFAVARNQVFRQMRARDRHLSLEDEEPVASGCVLADFSSLAACASWWPRCPLFTGKCWYLIEGVEAEGTRSTFTIPAGEIGNDQPLNTISERWYSNELKTVVLTTRKDPRSGESNYKLTNLRRSEPSPQLFEVPSGYKIVTEDNVGPEVIRMKIKKNQE